MCAQEETALGCLVSRSFYTDRRHCYCAAFNREASSYRAKIVDKCSRGHMQCHYAIQSARWRESFRNGMARRGWFLEDRKANRASRSAWIRTMISCKHAIRTCSPACRFLIPMECVVPGYSRREEYASDLGSGKTSRKNAETARDGSHWESRWGREIESER